jgi:hypothetical protein
MRTLVPCRAAPARTARPGVSGRSGGASQGAGEVPRDLALGHFLDQERVRSEPVVPGRQGRVEGRVDAGHGRAPGQRDLPTVGRVGQ